MSSARIGIAPGRPCAWSAAHWLTSRPRRSDQARITQPEPPASAFAMAVNSARQAMTLPKSRSSARASSAGGAQARHAPTRGRERPQSLEPSDLVEPHPRGRMNKKAAFDRDRAAPSSPASAANRIRATESLLAKRSKDFCNKIGTQEPSWSALGWSAYRGAADYDAGALSSSEPQLSTRSRHEAGRNPAPQRSLAVTE